MLEHPGAQPVTDWRISGLAGSFTHRRQEGGEWAAAGSSSLMLAVNPLKWLGFLSMSRVSPVVSEVVLSSF